MVNCIAANHTTSGLHGDEDSAERDNDASADASAPPRKRDDGELGCDDARIAEVRDRVPLRLKPVVVETPERARRIGWLSGPRWMRLCKTRHSPPAHRSKWRPAGAPILPCR
jgi:hypothetical protein